MYICESSLLLNLHVNYLLEEARYFKHQYANSTVLASTADSPNVSISLSEPLKLITIGPACFFPNRIEDWAIEFNHCMRFLNYVYLWCYIFLILWNTWEVLFWFILEYALILCVYTTRKRFCILLRVVKQRYVRKLFTWLGVRYAVVWQCTTAAELHDFNRYMLFSQAFEIRLLRY